MTSMLKRKDRKDSARARRLAMAAVRLRLKPSHRVCGFVQGAWWPRSSRLTAELPSLLRALKPRLGVIDRVRHHQPSWSLTPSSMEHRGTDVILEASPDGRNVITVFGKRFGALTLLVVPPHTDTGDAYAAMTTASRTHDASSADQLLGIDGHSFRDRRHTRIALQRWESEGGTVPAHA